MKIKKPLMVKLSASLLIACGVALPVLGASGWNETPAGSGNWVLTGTSTQTDQVVVGYEKTATLSSGSLWTKFDPTLTSPAAAIYFGSEYGTLKMNGGRLAVNLPLDGETIGVYGSDTMTIAAWTSASSITVNNQAGDATGVWCSNDLNIGTPPVILPGDPYELLPRATNVISGTTTVTAARTAYGLVADDQLKVWGNMNGTVTVSGGRDAYGLSSYDCCHDSFLIAGALSGKVTATAGVDSDSDYGAYAVYTYGSIEILGALSGTLTATSIAGNGNAYGIYADNDDEDFGIRIGGNLSGKVTVTSSNYAAGLYSNYYGDIEIGGMLSGTVVATGYDATGLYAEDDIIIKGKLSGTVTATAEDDAYGLEADDGIYIGGDLSGKVTAKGGSAYALRADYIEIGDVDAGKAGNLSGRVTVTGVGQAYGLGSYYGISINGNLSGTVTVTTSSSDGEAYGLITDHFYDAPPAPTNYYSPDYGSISIAGSLSGKVTVTGGDQAFGIFATNELRIGKDLSGTVKVATTGPDNGGMAIGLGGGAFNGYYDASGVYIAGNLSGSVTVTSAGGRAIGILGNNIGMYGNLSGSVTATGYDGAMGMIAINGLQINGNLTGKITAKSTGITRLESQLFYGDDPSTPDIESPDYEYYVDVSVPVSSQVVGLASVDGDLMVAGNVTGTVVATAASLESQAMGIGGADSVFIGGSLSGSTTVSADLAAGIFAGNADMGFFLGAPVAVPQPGSGYHMLQIGKDFTGKILVTGGTAGFGMVSMEYLNIVGKTAGTITVNASGTAYGMGAADTMTLGSSMAELQAPASPVPAPVVADTTGTIKVTGGQNAYGLFAGAVGDTMSMFMADNGWDMDGDGSTVGTIEILGNLSGKVTATAQEEAIAVAAVNSVRINKNMSGTLTATATTGAPGSPAAPDDLFSESLAAGILCMGDVEIDGNLSGTINATAVRAIGVAGGHLEEAVYSPAAATQFDVPPYSAVGGVDIQGNLSGKITATGQQFAMGVIAVPDFFMMDSSIAYSEAGNLNIGGSLSGSVKVTGGEGAIGLGAANSVFIGGSLSGSISSTAGYSADGIYADNDLYIDGNLSGSVTVTAGQYADGLDVGDDLSIGGNLSGKVTVTSGGEAYGLYAGWDLSIDGNLSGSVTATSTGEGSDYYDTYGLYAEDDLYIGGALSGKVIATSAYGHAGGMYAEGNLGIHNGITKTGLVSATGWSATAIEAYAGDIDDGEGGAMLIAGTVKAVGQESATAITAGGTMNLNITGTVSATIVAPPPVAPASSAAPLPPENAYAILSTSETADDTILLGSGARVTGAIDLGGNTEEVGDKLTVAGRGSYAGSISGVEDLVVNADSNGWQLGGLNSNGTFKSITLNSGVFGFGTKEIVHVTTDSFIQAATSTIVIKFTDDDCDNITVNVDGVVQVGGKVKFVPFGRVTTQGVGHEWLTQLRPPAPLAAPATDAPAVFEVADSALIDSSVSSTTDDSGTVHYSVTASRRSLAPMASSGNEGIADALDQAFDNGEGSAALTGLAMMAAPEKIDICLGSFQPISATTYATLSGSQSFSAGVGSHLQSIRQGMTMASSPVKANLPSLAGTGDTAVGEVLQAARAAASETTEWQVSGRYLGDFGRLNSDGAAAGNRWKTNGFMVNLDRQINTNLVIGAAAGGSWSYIDINHDSGDAETTSLNARLYAAWFDGPWHVDALAGYGRNWNESRRHMAFLGETAKADWNSDVYTARLGGGYDLDLGDGWIVEPNAAAEYTRIQNDSYNEHGSSTNLSVDGNNFDSLRHLLGVALRKGFTLDNKMVIRPEARLTWAHEYMDTTVRTSASLFGGSFTTNGVKQARDSAIIGLGLNLQFNETVGGYVSYDAELSNDKTSQGVSVGIRFNF